MTAAPETPEGAETDFRRRMSYSDYLKLDLLLHAQAPLSTAHDETLFIIQHQTSELWMKLAIKEMRAVCEAIREDRLQQASKMLARVSRIFEQLNSAWDVLRTMTPSEYSQFRDRLGQSSGRRVRGIDRFASCGGNRLNVHGIRDDPDACLADAERLHEVGGGKGQFCHDRGPA